MAKLVSKEEAKKKALIGGIATGAGGTIAGLAAGTASHGPLSKTRIPPSETKKLVKQVAKRDVAVLSSNIPGAYIQQPLKPLGKLHPSIKKELNAGFRQALVERFGSSPEAVNKLKNMEAILVREGKPSASIIGHEAGHARLGLGTHTLGRIGGIGVPAAVLLSALGVKKEMETGKKAKGYRAAALGVGAVGTASVAAPEVAASVLGHKGLKKLKIPRKGGKLGLALAGASYLLPAAAVGLGAPAAIFAASKKSLKKEGSLAKAEQQLFSAIARTKSKAKKKFVAYIEKRLEQEFADMAKRLGTAPKGTIKLSESRWGKVAQSYEKTGAIPIRRIGKKILRRSEAGIGKVVDVNRQEKRQKELAKRKQFAVKTPIGHIAPANVIA